MDSDATSARWPIPRWWPEALGAGSLAVCAFAPWHPQAIFWGGLPLAFAVFALAALRPTRTGGVGLGVAVAVAVSTGLPRFEHAGAVAPFTLLFAAAWAVGFAIGQRRRYLYTLLRQERDRADGQAAAERLRIAREMHDVIAHSMSVIAVQAGFGQLVIDTRPDDARAALQVIETTGRETLEELRRMLGVLRDDTEQAGLAPAPSLADLPRLAEQTGRAGLRIELTVTGQARPLPAGLEAAAYRIVQEALTNVVKHAAAASARICVDYHPDELVLTITDDGSARPDPATEPQGRGLPGMRERVALYGGSVQAGAHPAGGFRVRARMPVDPSQTSTLPVTAREAP
ncbi:sensor histidine kinase [Catenulispora sp. NL8]|uniref:histidine kinase n=1 Tax=Catenulispora pinistramenti TaxID=2705254 RepID=A0ABS5KM98_9ACTN|nr:sensor histidine kinase [Catenulispora pinistramenti]MBS2547146.1 sensor histidine kinase [Catenulispora pinistramenti]